MKNLINQPINHKNENEKEITIGVSVVMGLLHLGVAWMIFYMIIK